MRPYFPATFYNIANLKQHVIKKSCADKQPGTKVVPWGDIVGRRKIQEERHWAEAKTTWAEGLLNGQNASLAA